MADLKKLFGGPAKESKNEEAEAQPAPAASEQQESASGDSKTQEAAKPKPKLAFLKSAPAQQITSSDSGSGQSDSKLPASGGESPSSRVSTESSKELDGPALDSLDALVNTEVEGKAPRKSRTELSGFADELPAEAPLRDLPEEMSQEERQFLALMDSVYEVTNDPDMLGSVIKSIMIELKSAPQYMKLVSDSDIHVWIRAMRETMGLAKISKKEAKAKRSGGGKAKSKAVDNDMLSDPASLGLDFDE